LEQQPRIRFRLSAAALASGPPGSIPRCGAMLSPLISCWTRPAAQGSRSRPPLRGRPPASASPK
jgi:hypothetical protein